MNQPFLLSDPLTDASDGVSEGMVHEPSLRLLCEDEPEPTVCERCDAPGVEWVDTRGGEEWCCAECAYWTEYRRGNAR